jgi:phosphotransferase system HPr (HPr) family protein
MQVELTLLVRNSLGLHSSTSAYLVHRLQLFEEHAFSIGRPYSTKLVDATSMLEILQLGIGFGETVRLIVDGPDAESVGRRVHDYFEERMAEEEVSRWLYLIINDLQIIEPQDIAKALWDHSELDLKHLLRLQTSEQIVDRLLAGINANEVSLDDLRTSLLSCFA